MIIIKAKINYDYYLSDGLSMLSSDLWFIQNLSNEKDEKHFLNYFVSFSLGENLKSSEFHVDQV